MKIKFIHEIRTEYSETGDMTIILRETTEADGRPYSTEVIGFYYGTPNPELTKANIGRLKAEY